MPFALEFESITKEYGSGWRKPRIWALDGFSLQIEQGEIFGFLGPNGAGKTTAIHLAMGFMRPTQGTGRMLGARFGDAATRRRVGFVAENVALYHRPVKDSIRFYGALNGLRDPLLRQRTREALATMELTGDADRNVGKFSRGMQQRVGLAQALVNDPELLILDEPTSALDPLARIAVRDLLRQARAAGKTIFVSSHMLSEIELICDRVGILNRGRLVRVGTTPELLESQEQYEVVARGIRADAFPGALASNGTVQFHIQRSEQKAVVERVWAMGGEVVRFNPRRRTLEEIFVELTSQGAAPVQDSAPVPPKESAE